MQPLPPHGGALLERAAERLQHGDPGAVEEVRRLLAAARAAGPSFRPPDPHGWRPLDPSRRARRVPDRRPRGVPDHQPDQVPDRLRVWARARAAARRFGPLPLTLAEMHGPQRGAGPGGRTG